MGGVRATAAIRKRSLQRVYPIASPQSPANGGGFRILGTGTEISSKSVTYMADGVSDKNLLKSIHCHSIF